MNSVACPLAPLNDDLVVRLRAVSAFPEICCFFSLAFLVISRA
jgi:hypothetical protein